MKILINENQLRLIKETIDPSEAYSNVIAVKTICDGKRNVAVVADLTNNETSAISDMIYEFDLDIIKIPSNKHDGFIIFKKGHDEQANALLNLAEKYGGYLSYLASDEDTREIGRLLEYDPESVEDFIRKNKS